MIYATPSSAENSFLDNAPTGLTGTLTWKLLDTTGTEAIAESTAGITEIETGVYHRAFTAPADLGDYLLVWTNGSTLVTEEVSVVGALPFSTVPTDANLTTLASVQTFMQKDGDTEQDALIEALIPAASKTIMGWTGREFAPASTATRKFRYTGGGYLDLGPYDLRSATSIQRDTDTTSPTDLVVTTDYTLSPLNAPEGVYTALFLPGLRNTYLPGTEISITGDWGFATVPADVQHWCNVTIKWWIENDVSAFSSGFDANTDQFTRGHSLPEGVRRGLEPYRRVTVG